MQTHQGWGDPLPLTTTKLTSDLVSPCFSLSILISQTCHPCLSFLLFSGVFLPSSFSSLRWTGSSSPLPSRLLLSNLSFLWVSFSLSVSSCQHLAMLQPLSSLMPFWFFALPADAAFPLRAGISIPVTLLVSPSSHSAPVIWLLLPLLKWPSAGHEWSDYFPAPRTTCKP